MASTSANFPVFSLMDTKGKILNGAFSVVTAYVIEALPGYVSSVILYTDVILKLTAEILVVAVA